MADHILKMKLSDIENLITVNEGTITEQLIGSTQSYYIDNQLYYWVREKKNAEMEIDFVTELTNSILPIEVKAGKTGTLKSLHIYAAEKKLKTALRFNTDVPPIEIVKNSVIVGNAQQNIEFKLVSLPLYLVLGYHRIIENLE